MEKKELPGGRALDICSAVSSSLFLHMSLCVRGGSLGAKPRTAAGKLGAELLLVFCAVRHETLLDTRGVL